MRGKWKQGSDVPRHCVTCGDQLMRRRHESGRLEGYRDFMRRRFCSLSCANSRSKGGESRNAYLYRARKFLKVACECCGAKSELHAHHVNCNWRDNRAENIQTLCVFCHQFWHAMHIRHGRLPTQPMPKLVFLLALGCIAESSDLEPTAMPSSRRKRLSSSPPMPKSEA